MTTKFVAFEKIPGLTDHQNLLLMQGPTDIKIPILDFFNMFFMVQLTNNSRF